VVEGRVDLPLNAVALFAQARDSVVEEPVPDRPSSSSRLRPWTRRIPASKEIALAGVNASGAREIKYDGLKDAVEEAAEAGADRGSG